MSKWGRMKKREVADLLKSIDRMDPDLAMAAKAALTSGDRVKIAKTMATIATAQAERYRTKADGDALPEGEEGSR